MPVTTPKMTMIVVLLSLLLSCPYLFLAFFLLDCPSNEMVVAWFSHLQLRLSIAFRQVAENSTYLVMVMVMVICIVLLCYWYCRKHCRTHNVGCILLGVFGIVFNVGIVFNIGWSDSFPTPSPAGGACYCPPVQQCNCERSYHVTVPYNCATVQPCCCPPVQQ